MEKKESIFDLPPTSYSIVQGHIPRWFYIVKELSNLLNPDYEPLNPLAYQWTMENEGIMPAKNLLRLPVELTSAYHCKARDIHKMCAGRCTCLKNGVKCTKYCDCRKNCNVLGESRQVKRKKPAKTSRRTSQRKD